MSKPLYWLVLVAGKDPQRFTRRTLARAYAQAVKLAGHSVIVKSVGF